MANLLNRLVGKCFLLQNIDHGFISCFGGGLDTCLGSKVPLDQFQNGHLAALYIDAIYQQGLDAMEQKNYAAAMEFFHGLNYLDSQELYISAIYQHGMESYYSRNLEYAKKQFLQCSGYLYSDDMCSLIDATELYESGEYLNSIALLEAISPAFITEHQQAYDKLYTPCLREVEKIAYEEIMVKRNYKFVAKNLERFTKLSGNEIAGALIGEWKSTKGYLEIFYKDGRYLAGDPSNSMVYDFKSTWTISGDCLNIGGALWDVYQLYDGVYYIHYINSGNILTKNS